MKNLFILTILVFGMNTVSFAQKKAQSAAAPIIDQKKLAKANTLVSEAMSQKDKTKQADKLAAAMALFSEMKMSKEGSIQIGDAFYNAGDLKTASRWYGKGGKENKVETNKKIGEAYLEDAFNETDPKIQKKALDNSFKSLSKAHGANEANRLIGNQYFDQGEAQYSKALEYYEKAGYKEGIYMIADIYAKKPESIELACQTYVRTKDRDGYKKAGDLHFDRNEYVKAMSYYTTGGVIDGYKRYAIELKKAGKKELYNQVVEVITDTLKMSTRPEDKEALKEYAVIAERENNFPLAASLYKKLGNAELEKKYNAYSLMMSLDVIPAKDQFNAIPGKEYLSGEIDKNIAVLTDLQQSMLSLVELQKNVPKLNTKINSATGETEYDKNDIELRDKFYGNPANQKAISDVVYTISKNYMLVKGSDELKGLVRQGLMRFSPVKNILDNYDFTKKIIPINITPAAVTF